MSDAAAHLAVAARFRRWILTDAAQQRRDGVSAMVDRRVSAVDEAAGAVVVEFRVPARFATFAGYVHGGIIATMLDEAASIAVFARVGPFCSKGTAQLAIQYVRWVMPGPLVCRARVLDVRERTVTAEAVLCGPDGAVWAKADATMAIDFARPVRPAPVTAPA